MPHPLARNVLSVALRIGLIAGPSALLGAADYYQLPISSELTTIYTALRRWPL